MKGLRVPVLVLATAVLVWACLALVSREMRVAQTASLEAVGGVAVVQLGSLKSMEPSAEPAGTAAAPAEAARPAEPVKADEPARRAQAALPAARAGAASAAPDARAEARPAKASPGRRGAGRRVKEDRDAIIAAGMAYFRRSNKTLDGLPEVWGESDTVEDYIEFAGRIESKFVVYDPAKRRYLGELKLGGRPYLEPVSAAEVRRMVGGYAGRGRQVDNAALVALAEEAAQAEAGGVELWAYSSERFAAYLAYKIVEAQKALAARGVDPRGVLAFRGRYSLEGGEPMVELFAAVMKAGRKEIPLRGQEAT